MHPKDCQSDRQVSVEENLLTPNNLRGEKFNMKKQNEFYLRDTRSDVGSTCMFWRKNGAGYTSNLDDAEVFDFDGAQKYADEKRHFIPLSKARVDEVATVRVDMQYLELNVDFSGGAVIQRCCGQYDGNDIFFDDGNGGFTANYSEAVVYENLDILQS